MIRKKKEVFFIVGLSGVIDQISGSLFPFFKSSSYPQSTLDGLLLSSSPIPWHIQCDPPGNKYVLAKDKKRGKRNSWGQIKYVTLGTSEPHWDVTFFKQWIEFDEGKRPENPSKSDEFRLPWSTRTQQLQTVAYRVNEKNFEVFSFWSKVFGPKSYERRHDYQGRLACLFRQWSFRMEYRVVFFMGVLESQLSAKAKRGEKPRLCHLYPIG